ncbi:MAG: MFS transporter [Verrucomicrobiales bacterium]|nr:MFS transporter [Verrucomicrobiales bacterium]
MSSPENDAKARRNRLLVLLAAFLGWLFDGFEMGLFPLVGPPALADLLGPDAPAGDSAKWFGAIIAVFLVGAASGGVIFGWLGDKIGRVRAMALSILTYALFTGFCGFATEAWQLAALRFIASLGMGGEWSLGVALVNEVWPGKSRAIVAGLIGAAANFGYLLVAVLSMSLLSFIDNVEGLILGLGLSQATADHLLQNSAWRFLMISGALPALLIFLIRAFVPESEKWEEEHAKGTTSHWARADLVGVLGGSLAALVIIWAWSPAGVAPLLATGITVVGLAAAGIGFLHPVRQYLRRAVAAGSLSPEKGGEVLRMMLLGAGLGAVALLGTWGSTQWAPRWATELEPDPAKHAKEWTLIWLSLGAITGTFLAAIAAGRFGRRITYVALCVLSLASALILYQGNSSYGDFFLPAAFLAGTMTASFYGFFPLYFPELFPTAVRATGQGFAFNFGRILAAVGGLQTATLMSFFGGSFPMAGSVMAAVYIFGIVLIYFAPETKGRELPE